MVSQTGFRNRGRAGAKGFTLIELLCVMVIIGLLSSLSLSLLGVFRGNSMRGSLNLLSGVFDLARQSAISKNSFVWVVFTEPSTESDDLYVAVIGSKSGTDPIAWNTSTLQVAGNPDLELCGKVQSLSKIRMVDAGTVLLPNLPVNGSGSVNSLATVSIKISVGGQPKIFTRAVQFTPTGEAHVNSSAGLVEIGIQPKLEGTSVANVAVMRVAGVTGKVSVYRP